MVVPTLPMPEPLTDKDLVALFAKDARMKVPRLPKDPDTVPLDLKLLIPSQVL